MEENKEIVCCHYRNWCYLWLSIFFLIAFCGFVWLLVYICGKDPLWYVNDFDFLLIFTGYVSVLLWTTIYYILKMINERAILTDKTITIFSIWGRKKEYDLTEVTKIIYKNMYRETYVTIKIGRKKFKAERYATNRFEFGRKLAEIFNLDGFSRYGIIKFNV